MSATFVPFSALWSFSSAAKWLRAIDRDVCLGGEGIGSSSSERGDLPAILETLDLCGEVRRGGDALEGVMPPIPRKELLEALRAKVGVEDRECWLMELDDRLRGLLGGSVPFGESEDVRSKAPDCERADGEREPRPEVGVLRDELPVDRLSTGLGTELLVGRGGVAE